MINRSIATVNTWRGPRVLTVKHLLLIVGLLTLIGAALALWGLYGASANQADVVRMPLNLEMEERFGIRFTFLGVTANGGMIDLRYRVIDAAKAKNFGHYTETAPRLISEENGKVVDVTVMGLHNHRVEPGRVYYILFRNTGSAIQPGDSVTIAIDDLSLEHAISW
jgi:hypothetical protein